MGVRLRQVIWLAPVVLLATACGGNGPMSPTSTSSSSTIVAPVTSAPAIVTPKPVLKTYRYDVRSRGTVTTDLESFATHAAATFADERGWSMGGTIRFERTTERGDFTLWLAESPTMTSFGGECDVNYSCRADRDVAINESRWLRGGDLDMPLDEYRHMVVNHEVGHWLGLGHSQCPSPGAAAFVMQQQTKGGQSLGQCTANAWPLEGEKNAVLKRIQKGR